MNYASKLLAATLAVALISPAVLIAQTVPTSFRFNQNLTFGRTVDPDVKYLQTILNSHPQTQVAATGAGSNSNLTSYFGQKTRDAVMRFQTLYSAEVLAPAGLTQPTGNVGSFTRTKLNALISAAGGTPSGTPGNQQTGTAQNVNDPIYQFPNQTYNTIDPSLLYSIVTDNGDKIFTLTPAQLATVGSSETGIVGFSVYKAVPGQTISIYGRGFHPTSNTVYFGQFPVTGLKANANRNEIQLTVPPVLPNGYYHLAVSSAYGMVTSGTNVLTIDRTIVGATLTNPVPTLSKVYPTSSIYMNDPITLTGKNFSLFGNNIITNLGTLYDLPSPDGETLRFIPGSLPSYMRAFNQYKGMAINLLIKVRNNVGTSTDQLTHVINLPNAASPLVNQDPDRINRFLNPDAYIAATTSTSTQRQSTTSGGSSGGSSSGSGTEEDDKPMADPILDLKRRLNPIVKLLTDDYVSSESISEQLTGMGGPTSMLGGGGGALGGGGGGSGGGGGGGAGGGV